MTMTAISKGFRKIMRLLSEYGNEQENNVKIETMWTNTPEMIKTDRQNDERLGELNLIAKYFLFI